MPDEGLCGPRYESCRRVQSGINVPSFPQGRTLHIRDCMEQRSVQRDSNSRHLPWQGSILPLNYGRKTTGLHFLHIWLKEKTCQKQKAIGSRGALASPTSNPTVGTLLSELPGDKKNHGLLRRFNHQDATRVFSTLSPTAPRQDNQSACNSAD